ncbi:DMT family transporter [Acinetobacter rathckeae]|uniref:DMT family transporter n=1 Tax=Acinetobacter rathckeae TaxID=2605272 RepID=UPI0018A3355D|nr:DMT family transporter [Acinetobacter rathckeae]MBF7688843.1 DMT family transporter [Acinetobacter rathckeae]MBF7696443.1 DMT family transporter [Acinetobacter rathckeae]
MSIQSKKWPELALVFITLLWGCTFIVVQMALTMGSPMFFVGCRFAAAGLVLLLLYFKVLKHTTWQDAIAGIGIGLTIAIGYGSQTIGLKSILSSESAFITALYVPLVPILQWVIFKKMPKLTTWIGVLCAFVGLVLLTGNHSLNLSLSHGQIFTLLSACAVATEIVLIGWVSKYVNTQRVTIIQLLSASFFAFCSMPIFEESFTTTPPWQFWAIIVAIGIATALIQFVMNWAQQYVEPARATIIYAGEPVWAGLIGRIAGERLSSYAIFGAILVFIGVLISDLKLKRSDKTSTT